MRSPPKELERVRGMLPDANLDQHPFTRRDIPSLILLLKDPESSNRCDAIIALTRLRARKAVPPIIRRLRDPKWVVRCEAAETLGALGDKRAIPALRRALKSRNQHVRYYAAVALGDLRDAESRSALEAMRRKLNVSDRIAASGALYLITRQPLFVEDLGRCLVQAPRYELRWAAFETLKWVMRRGDAARVKAWLREALRAERESPGLRKDLRKCMDRL